MTLVAVHSPNNAGWQRTNSHQFRGEEVKIYGIVDNIIRNKAFIRYTISTAIWIGLLTVFLYAPQVEAHATLLETNPSESVVIEEPPSTLKLHFNEPIEQDLAHITVYDWNAKPVFTGDPDGGSDRAPVLEFALPKLKQGTYTVHWNAVSLDGHPVSGSYFFAVGKATEGGVKSVADAGESTCMLIIARTIAEGLLLLGAGFFWFAWLAERRHFPGSDTLFRRGRRMGAAFLVLATIAELVAYATSLPAGIIQTVINGRWDLLVQFPFVLMLFAQLLFLILLFVPGMVRGWYLFMWLLLAATPAFGGHVWGMENTMIALIPRVVHQLAIALWLGALCYTILLIFWQKKQGKEVAWKAFRPFFVNRMMVASGLVVLSGIMMVFLQTGWIAVVTDWMGWSTLLLVKLILTTLMLSLALFQTLKWKKRERFSTFRIIRVEWIAGLAVILIGVWMSQLTYPIPVKSYDSTLMDGQVQAEVNIDKLQTGEQQMIVRISAIEGEKPVQLSVDLSMPDHGMKSGPFTAEQVEVGEYQATLPFSMPGTWRIVIHAEYPEGVSKEWMDDVFIVGRGNG